MQVSKVGDIDFNGSFEYYVNPIMKCSQALYCKHKHCYHRFEHTRYNKDNETICNGVCYETNYPAGCIQTMDKVEVTNG
jgi:hypothetical protein